MPTIEELNAMQNIDPMTVDINDLVDIQDIKINMDLPKEERILDFIKQIKNPFLFRCGSMVVISSFSKSDVTLTERLEQYLRII